MWKKERDYVIEVESESPLDLENRAHRVRPEPTPSPAYEGPEWNTKHPLAGFFDSISVDDFLKDYWGRKVYHFKAKDAERFSEYYEPEDILRLWYATQGRVGEFAGRSVEAVAHEAAKLRLETLRGIHQFDPAMSELARQFEEMTGLTVTIDLFQQFPQHAINNAGWHWDPLDKFLIQFDGEGVIEIYEPFAAIPLPQQDPFAFPLIDEREMKLVEKVHRKKGDIVYIPRGVPHRHLLKAGQSVHAPVWLHMTTWYDVVNGLLSEALLKCELNIDFRKSCQFPRDVQNTRQVVQKLMTAVVDAVDPDMAEYYFQKHQRQMQGLSFDDLKSYWSSLRASDKLAPETKLQTTRRKTHLRQSHGELELAVGNMKLYFPEDQLKALRFALRGRMFAYSDLDRFELGKKAQKELVECLIEHRVLRVSPAKKKGH